MKIKIKKYKTDKLECFEPYGTNINDLNKQDFDFETESESDISVIKQEQENENEYENEDEYKNEDENENENENKKVKEKPIKKGNDIKCEENNKIIMLLEKVLCEQSEIKRELNNLKLEIQQQRKYKIPILKDIKKESLDIDHNRVKVALKLNSILGDMMLFKNYYIIGDLKPIKNINMKHYEYWANGKWNVDYYGKEIMEVISNNLKMTYVKVNTADNFEVEQFIENQKHIFQLDDEKYKRELLRQIAKVISA